MKKQNSFHPMTAGELTDSVAPSRTRAKIHLANALLAMAALFWGSAQASGQTFDWSGTYVGGYVSFNQGKLDTQGDVSHLSTDEDEVPIIGIFGGHRWNLGNGFVGGVGRSRSGPARAAQRMSLFTPLPLLTPRSPTNTTSIMRF